MPRTPPAPTRPTPPRLSTPPPPPRSCGAIRRPQTCPPPGTPPLPQSNGAALGVQCVVRRYAGGSDVHPQNIVGASLLGGGEGDGAKGGQGGGRLHRLCPSPPPPPPPPPPPSPLGRRGGATSPFLCGLRGKGPSPFATCAVPSPPHPPTGTTASAMDQVQRLGGAWGGGIRHPFADGE